MVELEEWFKSKEIETCETENVNVSRIIKKHFRGVCKRNNRWRARVRHPKLKVDVSCGCYSSPEEALRAVEKKRAEFDAMFKGGDFSGLEMGSCRSEFVARKVSCEEVKRVEFPVDDVLEGADDEVASKSDFLDGKVPRGVRRVKNTGKWVARIKDPVSRSRIWLGTYKTVEEAIKVFNKKKAEFAIRMKRKSSIGWSEVDEELVKFECEVGCDSPTTSLGVDDLNKMADIGDNQLTGDVKVPPGVTRKENGEWVAITTDTVSRSTLGLGTYKTSEEAIRSLKCLNRTKAEFTSGIKKVKFDESEANEGHMKIGCELVCDSPTTSLGADGLNNIVAAGDNELTADVKVPRGVTRNRNGKCVARTRDPVSRTTLWLGTYKTAKEAIRSVNKKKAELAARMKRSEFDMSKSNEGPVKFECKIRNGSPTSSLGVDDLNNIASPGDESKYGVVDIPFNPGSGLVHNSYSSVSNLVNSNSVSVSDNSCGLDFDIATSLGFINEYGQLMGKFSELDEHMGLGFPDENFGATIEDICRVYED